MIRRLLTVSVFSAFVFAGCVSTTDHPPSAPKAHTTHTHKTIETFFTIPTTTTVAPVATTTTAPVAPVATTTTVVAPAQIAAPQPISGIPTDPSQVTPELRAAWDKVAVCEEGGIWNYQGPVYSGIGFLNSTWVAYGGLQYAPNAGMAAPEQQIVIGMKINNGFIPDQNGCAAW